VKAGGGFERTAELAYILPYNEHCFVGAHFLK
jgi:hypothetical protein